MRPVRKPLVDLGTRVAHAAMALAFIVAFLSAESEYWQLVHVYSGYALAFVLVFRLVWGWIGPASARWSLLLRRLGLWRLLLQKTKQGQWALVSFWVMVSGWALSAAVVSLYTFCAVATVSGLAHYNELLGDSWLNDALQELHEGTGDATWAVVCFHVGLVVTLRVWRGPLAVRPMWRGDANTSG